MLRAKLLAQDPLGFFDFPSLPFAGCERPVINGVRHDDIAQALIETLSPRIVFGHTKLRDREAARPDDILRSPHQPGPDPQPLEGRKHSKCPDEARPGGCVLRQIHLHLSDRVAIENGHEIHAFTRHQHSVSANHRTRPDAGACPSHSNARKSSFSALC